MCVYAHDAVRGIARLRNRNATLDAVLDLIRNAPAQDLEEEAGFLESCEAAVQDRLSTLRDAENEELRKRLVVPLGSVVSLAEDDRDKRNSTLCLSEELAESLRQWQIKNKTRLKLFSWKEMNENKTLFAKYREQLFYIPRYPSPGAVVIMFQSAEEEETSVIKLYWSWFHNCTDIEHGYDLFVASVFAVIPQGDHPNLPWAP